MSITAAPIKTKLFVEGSTVVRMTPGETRPASLTTLSKAEACRSGGNKGRGVEIATGRYALPLLLLSASLVSAVEPEALTFTINDDSGKPAPCRLHLSDAAGKAVRAPGLPFWRDHFVCGGQVAIKVPPGNYSFEIERGPEYEALRGTVSVEAGKSESRTLQLKRMAHLAPLGWYSGDLHVHRPVEEIELLMQAEDLRVAPVITWWNARNLWRDRAVPQTTRRRFAGDRFYDVMAGEDERGGGALLFFHLSAPIEITKAAREHPCALDFVALAKQRNDRTWIDIEKPFWWDVPIWIASKQVDSIGIANNHMCRSQMYPDEAWGRPRDRGRLPDPRGNGYWTQEIYYHLLNCGLRLPPSAGSASGVLPNPVGYNRVYVKVDGEFTYDTWWEGLRGGRSFVTNGPLLMCAANGKPPGHVFASDNRLAVELDVLLTSKDRVRQLEVVQNGRVARTVDCSDQLTQRLQATITLERPGWFLVRAIAENPNTFRFASTAPYYAEIGGAKPRVSRASVAFFQQWLAERRAKLLADKTLANPEQQAQVLRYHDEAKIYWNQLAAESDSE